MFAILLLCAVAAIANSMAPTRFFQCGVETCVECPYESCDTGLPYFITAETCEKHCYGGKNTVVDVDPQPDAEKTEIKEDKESKKVNEPKPAVKPPASPVSDKYTYQCTATDNTCRPCLADECEGLETFSDVTECLQKSTCIEGISYLNSIDSLNAITTCSHNGETFEEGEEWTSGQFVFKCKEYGAYDIIACISRRTSDRVPVDESLQTDDLIISCERRGQNVYLDERWAGVDVDGSPKFVDDLDTFKCFTSSGDKRTLGEDWTDKNGFKLSCEETGIKLISCTAADGTIIPAGKSVSDGRWVHKCIQHPESGAWEYRPEPEDSKAPLGVHISNTDTDSDS